MAFAAETCGYEDAVVGDLRIPEPKKPAASQALPLHLMRRAQLPAKLFTWDAVLTIMDTTARVQCTFAIIFYFVALESFTSFRSLSRKIVPSPSRLISNDLIIIIINYNLMKFFNG